MSHDASLAVFSDNKLKFAAHAERYSRIKNDKNLNKPLLLDALEHGDPDEIYFYERPWLKKTRQAYARQWGLLAKPSPYYEMNKLWVNPPRIRTTTHHHSHAAYAYYTQPQDDCAVIVMDSIGEFETLTMWHGKNNKLGRYIVKAIRIA